MYYDPSYGGAPFLSVLAWQQSSVSNIILVVPNPNGQPQYVGGVAINNNLPLLFGVNQINPPGGP